MRHICLQGVAYNVKSYEDHIREVKHDVYGKL